MSFLKAAKHLVSKAATFAVKAAVCTAFVGATLAVAAAGIFVGAMACAVIAGSLSAISSPLAIAVAIGFFMAFRSGIKGAEKAEQPKKPVQQNFAPPSEQAARNAAAFQSRSIANDWQAMQQAQQRKSDEEARQRAAQAQASAQRDQVFNPDPYSAGGQTPYSPTNYYSPEYKY